MKEVIKDFNEITESKELFESQPNIIMNLFIYLLIGIIGVAFIWTYFGEIDVVVKASGVVRPSDRISTINNNISGKIESVYFEEGKKVECGENLYIIEHSNLLSLSKAYEKELNDKKLELKNLKKFKKSILLNENLFDKDDKDEELVYNKYLIYNANKTNYIDGLKLVLMKKDLVQDKINDLNKMIKSINEEKNLFKDKGKSYYSEYLEYSIEMDSLISDLEQEKIQLNGKQKLYEIGAIPQLEYENSEKNFEKKVLEFEKYKVNKKYQITNELERQKERLSEFDIELQKMDGKMPSEVSKYIAKMEEQFKINKQIEIDESIVTLEVEIKQLSNNLDLTKADIKKCIVKAPIGGYVNVLRDINRGDNLQEGVTIATIIPSDSKHYKIQLYVANQDIGNINIGDRVEYNFLSFPYKEYGKLSGKVVKIGKDTKGYLERQADFYLVEASIENIELTGYKGDFAKIKTGMNCEARIIVKTKKILYYLLEKIDLKI